MVSNPLSSSAQPRLAIALSGGGFRAALFHLGVMRRIAEAGWLPIVDVLSCVSGGSIIGAFMATRWPRIVSASNNANAFQSEVVAPFVDIVSTTNFIARWAMRLPTFIWSKLVSRSFTRTSAASSLYAQKFGLPAIQDLDPQGPYLVINASNLLSARAWRFTRDGVGDSRFGYARWQASFALGAAVAASAAFPPVFPPFRFSTERVSFSGPVYGGEQPLAIPAYMPLSDGGVYDNMGVEVLTKRTVLGDRTIEPAVFTIVSDGGYPPQHRFRANGIPGLGEGLLLYRVDEMARDQVGALRRRMLIRQFEDPRDPLRGALVVLSSSIGKVPAVARQRYIEAVGTECVIPAALLAKLHATRTHLNRFSPIECEALMYHGYTLTDAVLWTYRDTHPELFRTAHPGTWRIRFTPELQAAWVRGIAATPSR